MATVASVNELGGYTFNPRGNLWFKDESSYGQKLLLKMGWRKGKGLGKKEDGIKENLKVKFKNTNSGLGYKDDSHTTVMKTEYESILKSLRDKYSQQETMKGCNKDKDENKGFKQKVAKHKIRYPKLYYGKDVSKYSEKDMKSIFICSLPSKDNKEEKFKDSGLCVKRETENQLPKRQETYTSHLSISDYFNQKMMEKKDNEQKNKGIGKIKETEYVCNRADYKIKQKNFACGSNNNCFEIKQEKSDLQCHVSENAVTWLSRKKDKRKLKNTEENINGDDKDPMQENFACESNSNCFEIKQEKSDFQCHISENAVTGLSRKKDKRKLKNTEGNINGDDKDPMEENFACESNNNCFEIKQEKSYFQCHVSENAVTWLSRKKDKRKLKNTEGNTNGDDKDLMQKGSSKEIIPNKKQKKLSESSVCDRVLSEEKILENCNFIDDHLRTSSKNSKKSQKRKFFMYSADTETLLSCQSDEQSGTMSRKKRKKSHSNGDGTTVDEVELLSVVFSKDETLANSELANNLSAAGPIKLTSERLSDVNNNNSVKKKKKSKNKFNPLKDLKSCLKSNSKEYTVKNVTFNENISYKIIDSDNEFISSVSYCQDKEQNDLISDSFYEDMQDSGDSKPEIKDSSFNEQKENQSDGLETASEGGTEECFSSSSLPSSNSSHYNSWVESQRLALKMKLYKKLNGIRKHDILKSTNMLSLKGYGNWGF